MLGRNIFQKCKITCMWTWMEETLEDLCLLIQSALFKFMGYQILHLQNCAHRTLTDEI